MAKPSVWMIDDNIADLDIAGIVCEMIGFSGLFVPFTNAVDALKRLEQVWDQEEQRPRVILLDVNMPRTSGLATLRSIRKDPRWHGLPVVMFSTSRNEEEVARREGATDYLIKPALLADTVATMRAVIGRYAGNGTMTSADVIK